ncbi:MAG: dipeptidase E [Lachnospiraceae bacterium]|nr:dipeptidase E [Lachnospiraceae bacterium]
MINYLTSDPGTTYIEGKEGLNDANRFVENLKRHLKNNAAILIMSSDPCNKEMNDGNVKFVSEEFPKSGFTLSRVDICDDDHRDLVDRLNEYDLILLAGGHVPTESKFFGELDLYNKIRSYDGIVMGISAGTMNQATEVYAIPELEGESLDSNYKRFIPGLGFTNLQIIPHFQWLKTVTLDGVNMIEDIAYGDSYGREFLGVVDGAYVLIEDGIETLYGEGYIIKDGTCIKICNNNESKILR